MPSKLELEIYNYSEFWLFWKKNKENLNLIQILKFWWNLEEILKFGQNSEIRSNFWNLWNFPQYRLFFGPPSFLLGIPLWEGGVTQKNNLHQSHVCTDKFAQTFRDPKLNTYWQTWYLSKKNMRPQFWKEEFYAKKNT